MLSGHETRYEMRPQPHGELHLYRSVCCEVEGRQSPRMFDYDSAYRCNSEGGVIV
jgi:hypothetical protein